MFVGIELDSVTQTARLPLVKVNRILQLLHRWSRKSTCTRRELESLIGHLHHACRVVRPGRTFLRWMINLLCCFRNSSHPIRLNVESAATSSGGSLFSRAGMVSFFLSPTVSPLPDLVLSSDASGALGFGAVWRPNGFLNPGPFFLVRRRLPSWSWYLSLLRRKLGSVMVSFTRAVSLRYFRGRGCSQLRNVSLCRYHASIA